MFALPSSRPPEDLNGSDKHVLRISRLLVTADSAHIGSVAILAQVLWLSVQVVSSYTWFAQPLKH